MRRHERWKYHAKSCLWVGDLGSMRCGLTNRIFQPPNTNDYHKVRGYAAHRLVAELWIGTSPGKGYIVNHKNGHKNDNRVDNLEWCTQSANVRHALETGLIPYRGQKPETLEYIKRLHSQGHSFAAIGRHLGLSGTRVAQIVRGK